MRLLYEERQLIDVAWVRIVIFGYFVYKLLSRDFSSLGFMPSYVLDNYPYMQYSLEVSYVTLGLPFIVDLFTFHWIHWAVPLPTEKALFIVQWISIFACTMVLLFGRGPKRVFAIISYCLLSYLWGFIWRAGQDEDAVFIPLQIALVYCFSTHKEALLLWKSAPLFERSKEAGWFFSMVILIFISYYFLSGVNKIVDLPPSEIFGYELGRVIGLYYDMKKLGYYRDMLDVLVILRNQDWLTYIGPPLVYLSHLLIVTMYFNRRWIVHFWQFYWLFILMSGGVSIWFFGLGIAWLVFLPVHRFFQPMVAVWDGDCLFCMRWVNRIKKLDWFGLIHFINSNEVSKAPAKWVQGWNKQKGLEAMWVRGIPSNLEHFGFYGFRRMAWVLPLMWPFLIFLYLPLVPTVGSRVYAWVAKNRYRFGCQSDICDI